ncbi:pentapeptide repeat-containing protein [Streptomyces sp. NBC_01003]|uniref:pentapeptide repeat-containing protein n=1 Tax=Streptomyces sp. NBC_01003 TaxID=2903714 RepID=UPI00386D8CC4
MSTSPAPARRPHWPHCRRGADPTTDPVGCCGIHVPGYTTCLAHLDDRGRNTYLASLTPGADIDHRGTPFTQNLLQSLLRSLRDPTTGKPHLGKAWFSRATFTGPAHFDGARFAGGALFHEATFTHDARFDSVTFSDHAEFGGGDLHGRRHVQRGDVREGRRVPRGEVRQ